MNMRSKWLPCLLCVSGLLAASSCRADDATPSRWFFQGGIGVGRAQDVDATLNFTLSAVPGTFDDGPRLDAVIGYWLQPGVALAFETGLSRNELTSLAGSSAVDATTLQSHNLATLIWRPYSQARVSPLLGVGAGFALSKLDIGHANLQGTSLHGDELTWTFAGQAFAGVDWRVSDTTRIGVVYKYLRTGSPEWDLHSFDDTKAFGVIRLEDPVQHSLQLTFAVDF